MEIEDYRKYVYGLYNSKDELLYIGQSDYLELRLKSHKKTYPDVSYMEVLDTFVDKEQYWIETKLEEGVDLYNKKTGRMRRKHRSLVEIGDRIYVKEKKKRGDYWKRLTREEKLHNKKWWYSIIDLQGNILEKDLMSGEVSREVEGFWNSPTSKVKDYRGQKCKVIRYPNPYKSK